MAKRIQIGYAMESPAPDYAEAIRMAQSKEALVEAIDFFMPITPDALAMAKKFTEQDFKDFQRDIKKAKDPKQKPEWIRAFVERFGHIAAPSKMLMTDLIAEKYHAPWGTAFIRYEEINKKK